MSFQKNIWFGFLSALAIIAWLAIISYQNNKGTRKSMMWVAHTNRVLFHSEQILSLIVDLESGQRGYSLTGIEDFLEPTYDAVGSVEEHTSTLAELTSDNAGQMARAVNLQRLVATKIKFTQEVIESRKRDGIEGARRLNATMRGKILMDSIRMAIRDLQEEERELLVDRTALAQGRSERFNKYFLAMLVVTGSILVLLFYAIHFNSRARERVQLSLHEASHKIEDIYNNAPCGYHSVNRDDIILEINDTFLQWLGYTRAEVVNKLRFRDLLAKDSIHAHDAIFEKFKKEGVIRDEEFEVVRKDGTTFFILVNATAVYDGNRNFVQSRSTVLDFTEQRKAHHRIEQLNQELESFSYSVSHDLRAPLRSIHGYTQILTEDYAGKLDDEGRRLLQVVVTNAQRMARLIDDLLDFSRISRKDIAHSRVNNDSLVHSIVSEMKAQDSTRRIEMKVGKLESCEADPNLLRQVWFNLLSNAFKYTRKKETAVIEVSSETTPGEVVFCVKDNGTGFDMQYSNKLFGVFQRLHRQTEFEGTGVGLAIVHRIITRHGGSVWATGEPDKGAAFYFSLPKIQQP